MQGYTPVFGSVYAGTLCGKWPAAAVWVSLLPLCDKRGHIEMSHAAISALTGWPLDLLKQGISELMEPDPTSRSPDEDGRRLVLLDANNRDWGWRVVNHGLYREKARKLSYDSERTASGRDAQRKKESRGVPTRPAVSRGVPLSDSDSDSDSNKEKRGDGERAARAPTARRLPDDFSLTEQRRAIARAERADADREFAKFTDHWRAASGANARKHDWDAAWRNWCRKAQDMRPNGRGPPADEPKLTWRPPPDEDEGNARR
jgi:hypothetical protein